jgi:hypothetical protein
MASIEQERKAAEAAKAAIATLSPAPLTEATITILQNANHAARTGTFSNQGRLIDARHELVIALSDLITGPPTQDRIDKAKVAVEDWINRLGNA